MVQEGTLMNDAPNPLSTLLAPYFDDPSVQEIMVDGYSNMYISQHGRLTDVPSPFRDDVHLLGVMQATADWLGYRLDRNYPILDASLTDLGRINMVIPPVSRQGPSMCIWLRWLGELTQEQLVQFGSWNDPIVTFLRACVEGRISVLVSGDTGAGKTSVLNILANMIPDEERVIVIESAAELRMSRKRIVFLESRPADHEGKGEVTVRDLVANAMRMRPDRLILVEAQASETLEMIQAMNNGHEGVLWGIHASSPRDALARLEMMCTMHDISLPLLTVRGMIASAVKIITHQKRLHDGTRKMLKIAEVLGLQGDVIVTQDLFEFRQTGVDPGGRVTGYFSATGNKPTFLEALRQQGIDLPADLFKPQ
jgi:pilus assembly protein CpaF